MAEATLLFRNAPRCEGGPSLAESVLKQPVRDGLPNHALAFTKERQRPEEELERRVQASRERSPDSRHSAGTFLVRCWKLAQTGTTSFEQQPTKNSDATADTSYAIVQPCPDRVLVKAAQQLTQKQPAANDQHRQPKSQTRDHPRTAPKQLNHSFPSHQR